MLARESFARLSRCPPPNPGSGHRGNYVSGRFIPIRLEPALGGSQLPLTESPRLSDRPPVTWQFEPFDIYTPDGGDTFHVAGTVDGQFQIRAMSRATLVTQLASALQALLGADADSEIATMLDILDRRSRR